MTSIRKRKKTNPGSIRAKNSSKPKKEEKPPLIQKREFQTGKNTTKWYSIDGGKSFLYGISILESDKIDELALLRTPFKWYDTLAKESKKAIPPAYLHWMRNVVLTKQSINEVAKYYEKKKQHERIGKCILPLEIRCQLNNEGTMPAIPNYTNSIMQGRKITIDQLTKEINTFSPYTYESISEILTPLIKRPIKIKKEKKIIKEKNQPEYLLVKENDIYYYGKVQKINALRTKIQFEEMIAFSYRTLTEEQTKDNEPENKGVVFQGLIFKNSHYNYISEQNHFLKVRTTAHTWEKNGDILKCMNDNRFNPQLIQLHAHNAYGHIHKLIGTFHTEYFIRTHAKDEFEEEELLRQFQHAIPITKKRQYSSGKYNPNKKKPKLTRKNIREYASITGVKQKKKKLSEINPSKSKSFGDMVKVAGNSRPF